MITVILGRLDAPGTALLLSRKAGAQDAMNWWGGDRLMAMHKIGSSYFSCSASQTGDELRVRRYEGDLGTFQIGAGSRTLKPVGVQGSLQSRDRAVAVGPVDAHGSPESAPSCALPAGEYLPAYLRIQLGHLNIAVSQNYHSDGKPRDRAGRPLVYGIQLRKERPFVLDFSEKPEVMFASPAKDLRVKLGSDVEIKAVLVDPKLDIMIRGLNDTSRRQSLKEGVPAQFQRDLSLDPKVIVSRANGEKVAEGVMPFG